MSNDDTQFGAPTPQQPPSDAGYAAPPPGYGGPTYPQGPGGPVGSQPKGLAIAALVLGIIAILGCWVPILNIGSIILGLVGIVIGIIALVKKQSKGMGITGLILSALAILIAIAVNIVAVIATDEIGKAVDESIAEAEAGYGTTTDEEADATTEAIAVGEETTIGDYTVSVTDVAQNGNDIVVQGNEYNAPPTGQYVIAEITVTYNGSEEGNPWLDLGATFQATDNRNYDACSVLLPNDAYSQPALRSGGTTTYQECFDIPPTAIAGGYVAIEDAFSFNGGVQLWRVQ